MIRRLAKWSHEGNGLARELFRVSDRLDILFRDLAEGVVPERYADLWNGCRQELDELRQSVHKLNSEVKVDVRLRTTFVELTYQTCVLQLVTCVDMQLMGCWIAVRANNSAEAGIAASCFDMARQTAMAYANAIKGVSQGKVVGSHWDEVLRELVKSFREELLPIQVEAEALVVKKEAEN